MAGPRWGERVDAVHDAFQLDGRQGGVDRQGEDLVGGRARGGQLRTGGVAGQGGQLVVRDRVVDARADAVLLAQGGGETIAVFGHADRVLVVDVRGTGGDVRDSDTSQVGVQEGGVVLTFARPRADLGELHPTDGRVDVGHAVVEAHDFVGVARLHALVAREPHASDNPGVGGGDHASLTAGHVLRRVEGEGREGTEGADRAPVQGGAVGLGGVLEDHEAALVGDCLERVHGSGMAVEVDGHDGPRALRDRGFNGGRGQCEGERVDVGEHGGRARDGDRVGGGREGEGGDDDLVARSDPGGEQTQVQSRGPRVDRGCPGSGHEGGGEFLLEGGDLGALGDHAGAHDGGDGLDLFLADERACGRDERMGHGWSSRLRAGASAVFVDEAWASSGERVSSRST